MSEVRLYLVSVGCIGVESISTRGYMRTESKIHVFYSIRMSGRFECLRV